MTTTSTTASGPRQLRLSTSMFFKELLRRWPTVLFMVFMPGSYFLVSYFTSDGQTTVPLAVPGISGELSVLDRDVKALYLAVLGISVTSSFAALATVQGTTRIMRRLRLMGYGASRLLLARLSVLGLIMALACAIFLLLFVPLVSVSSLLHTVIALILVSAVGVGLGTVVGLLLPHEFEAAMILIAAAGIQMALGRGGSDAERFLPYWPGVEALKGAMFDTRPGVWHLHLQAALYVVALLAIAAVIWSSRTQVWRPEKG